MRGKLKFLLQEKTWLFEVGTKEFAVVAMLLLDCVREFTGVVADVVGGGAEVEADGGAVENADDNTFEHCLFWAEDCPSM